MSNIQEKYIREINTSDSFFDSLRQDYKGFDTWIAKKANAGEKAYILFDDTKIVAFLYLKIESPIDNTDISPALDTNVTWLKIGTLKIDAHGTKLGERIIKKIFDFAVANNIYNIYVTSFEKQAPLIKLLKRYGFVQHGKKINELVLTKNIPTHVQALKNDILLDYPAINATSDKYLLSIYPKYHTGMFSDSMLNTESYDILKDMSESNSIHKVYIAKMKGVEQLKRGDCLLIYRTKDENAQSANYSSVVTSLCVVEEYKDLSSFSDLDDFIKYCKLHNIFTDDELENIFIKKSYTKIIKMAYNISFKRRVILKKIREIIGYEEAYWGFAKLTDEAFFAILKEGLVNDSIIIH